MSSVIHRYQPPFSASLENGPLYFSEVYGFNPMAGSRLFHCDEQALRMNLTGNRTKIQHSPLEEGVCVNAIPCVSVWVCVQMCL